MSHLDTAARTRECRQSPSRATHFIGSIGRALTVLDTSVDLSAGDRLDSPVRAQLLVVCESFGDEGERRRLNAMAIDSVTRELLRDDEWVLALDNGGEDSVTKTLASAVTSTLSSLASIPPTSADPPPGESSAGAPRLSLTAALVAWPLVAVAHAGSGVVIHLAGRQMLLPMQKIGDGPASTDGLDPPTTREWSIELGERDTIILGTSRVADHVADFPAAFGEGVTSAASAQSIAERLMGRVTGDTEAAIAVAKLSDGVNDQLQSLAEEEADPPKAYSGSTAGDDQLDQGDVLLVSEEPLP